MITHEIPEQPEDVRGRPVAITIAATVTGILVSAFVVYLLMRLSPEGGGRSTAAAPALVPPDTPFDRRTPIEAQRQAELDALDAWNWADPQHTRVRLPVSIAIERYLGEHK
jgi:hypothetical protein